MWETIDCVWKFFSGVTPEEIFPFLNNDERLIIVHKINDPLSDLKPGPLADGYVLAWVQDEKAFESDGKKSFMAIVLDPISGRRILIWDTATDSKSALDSLHDSIAYWIDGSEDLERLSDEQLSAPQLRAEILRMRKQDF